MDEEDYSSLPLEEKLAHKVWKVRLDAYGQLIKQFESSRSHEDECFTLFNSNPTEFKKIITDSNVVAHESGILALLKFLEYGGTAKNVDRLKSAGIVNALCEKGLSSSRAGTKEKTTQAILYLVEISDNPVGIVDDILPFLSNRLPKLVAGCVSALTTIVTNFGCQIINPNSIITALPKLFGHADKNVRAETTKLTVEVYKWVREALPTMLFPQLKPIQQKDLTAAFEKVKDEAPSQQRYTRRQQIEIAEKEAAAAAAAAADSNNLETATVGGDVEMDDEPAVDFNPFDLLEPVEILSKLPSDLNAKISSAKWKDRKEVLEEVHAILEKSVKLKPDDYTELVRIFAKNMKDVNVQVVQLAAECVAFLVNGLQSNFSRYQALILGPLIERLKEKKVPVYEALEKALDAIFKFSTLSSILEETIAGLNSKIPQGKILSLNYLKRCLAETKIAPSRAEIDAIMNPGVKLLSDSQEPVRNAASEMIGTLMKITGERELVQSMEKVDANRKAKVLAYFETATVKCKKLDTPALQTRKPLVAETPKRSAVEVTPRIGAISKSSIPSGRVGTSIASKKLSLPINNSSKKTLSSNLLPSKRGATSPAKNSDGSKRILESPTSGGFGELGSSEKEELLSLRKQKQQWNIKELNFQQQRKQIQDEAENSTRNLVELRRNYNELNSELQILQSTLRQRDTQLLRANSDLESSKLKIRDLEQTIEMQKLESLQRKHLQMQQSVESFEPLSNVIGPGSPNRGVGVTTQRVTSPFLARRSFLPDVNKTRISSGELSSRVNRLSIDPEFKENDRATPSRVSESPRPVKEYTNTYTSNLNKETLEFGGENDDSWRRAAEVTNQLKARIEKMKARSRANFS